MADGAVEGEEEVRYEEDIAERDRALLSSALTRPKDGRAPPSVDNDAEPGAGGRRVTYISRPGLCGHTICAQHDMVHSSTL